MAGFSLFTDLISPTKYGMPDYTAVDPSQIQLDTQAGNAASFQAAKGLATDYNAFMRQQQQQALEQGIPGYSNIAKQLSGNFQSQLKGELSSSDLAATQRNSAAKALGLGVAGSPFGAALTARDIGLRQYQVQQNAQAQAPGYLQTMRGLTAAPMYDFSNVFLSPQQRVQYAFQNNANQWQVANAKAQMAAQPEPWMKALAGFGDSILTGAASYATMGGFGGFGGGSMGGGGGGGMFGNLGVGSPMNFGGYGNSNFNMGDAAAMNYYLGR